MVQAQRCKVCGHRHWLIEVHIFTDSAKPTKAKKPAAVVPTPTAKPAFDRVAYQREYMRRRRAKQ